MTVSYSYYLIRKFLPASIFTLSYIPDNSPDIAVVAAAFPDEMNNGNSAT